MWRGGRGSRQPSSPSTPPPPLGDILATIQDEDLDDYGTDGHGSAQITNTRYLTSYNWIDEKDHQIIVPGGLAYLAMQITVPH